MISASTLELDALRFPFPPPLLNSNHQLPQTAMGKKDNRTTPKPPKSANKGKAQVKVPRTSTKSRASDANSTKLAQPKGKRAPVPVHALEELEEDDEDEDDVLSQGSDDEDLDEEAILKMLEKGGSDVLEGVNSGEDDDEEEDDEDEDEDVSPEALERMMEVRFPSFSSFSSVRTTYSLSTAAPRRRRIGLGHRSLEADEGRGIRRGGR